MFILYKKNPRSGCYDYTNLIYAYEHLWEGTLVERNKKLKYIENSTTSQTLDNLFRLSLCIIYYVYWLFIKPFLT